MLTFTIDRNNHITALTPHEQAQPDSACFHDAKELDRLAKRWPGSRLVEIWNALPGQKPVNKFTNQKVAVSRIWRGCPAPGPRTEPTGAAPGTRKDQVGETGE